MVYHGLTVVVLHPLRSGPTNLDLDESVLAVLPAAGLVNMACLTFGLPQEHDQFRFLDLDSHGWLPTPELAKELVGRRIAVVHAAAAAVYGPDPNAIASMINARLTADEGS